MNAGCGGAAPFGIRCNMNEHALDLEPERNLSTERLWWFLKILSVEGRAETSLIGPKWLRVFDGSLDNQNTMKHAIGMGLARIDARDEWFGPPEVSVTDAGEQWLRKNQR